jgi:Recombination endonuclease VII
MLKKCVKCAVEKDTTEFYKNKTYPDGFECSCKECYKGHVRQFQKNKRATDPEWAKKEQERLNLHKRTQRATNPEFRRKEKTAHKRRWKERYETDPAFREKELQRSRRKMLKKDYDITPAQYDEMHRIQGGVCYLCGSDNNGKRLPVDHNHTTLLVSGLLCFSCNIAKGHFKEDPTLMRKAAAYEENGGATYLETSGNAFITGEMLDLSFLDEVYLT